MIKDLSYIIPHHLSDGKTRIMMVHCVKNQYATLLYDKRSKRIYPVSGCLDNNVPLKIGDEVIVFASERGLTVLGRWVNPSTHDERNNYLALTEKIQEVIDALEPLQNLLATENGLEIIGRNGISLKSGRSEINLKPNGEISITGDIATNSVILKHKDLQSTH